MTHEVPEHRNRLGAAELVKLGELAMASERDGAVHTITLFGELDLATVDEVRHELEHAEASDVASIVLDLSGLTFMDSTGVRLLVEAHARSRADSDRLVLIRGPVSVQRVLEITGVVDLLPFAD